MKEFIAAQGLHIAAMFAVKLKGLVAKTSLFNAAFICLVGNGSAVLNKRAL